MLCLRLGLSWNHMFSFPKSLWASVIALSRYVVTKKEQIYHQLTVLCCLLSQFHRCYLGTRRITVDPVLILVGRHRLVFWKSSCSDQFWHLEIAYMLRYDLNILRIVPVITTLGRYIIEQDFMANCVERFFETNEYSQSYVIHLH